jgi:mono/diheme cytochrome c family protein
MVRWRCRVALGGLAAILATTACEDPMQQHPRDAMLEVDPIPKGSVPRGALDRQAALAAPARPLDLVMLQEGRELYDALCSVCHGRTGRGDGMVVRHGFPAPPSFHVARLQTISLDRIVKVITEGLGDMYPYANQIEPEDRWAVAAYVKALQLSQGLPLEALPEEDRLALPEEGEQ